MRLLRWVCWSRQRYLVTVLVVAAVASVISGAFLLARLHGFADAVASVGSQTTAPTSSPLPSSPAPLPTDIGEVEVRQPVQASTSSPVDVGEVTGPALAVARAWLGGDPGLAGWAHPDLVDSIPPAPAGLMIIGDPILVGDTAVDSALVRIPTNRGWIIVTMTRTDEIGWIAKALTA